jgi:hypothetical protein
VISARASHRIAAALGLVWFGWLAACGGAPQPAPQDPSPSRAQPAATDTRTPIERRRDAACEGLGPKLTACAVEDAKADLGAGKITQQQLERDIAPGVLDKNTEKFEAACKTAGYSSRQVRVLEVCLREEPRCAPLLDCLGHLSDAADHGAK